MKKIIVILASLIFIAFVAIVIWQNLPGKRHIRHMVKARLLSDQNNPVGAKQEYKKAFKGEDEYSPWVSLEVLEVENILSFKDNDVETALKNTKKYLDVNPKDSKGKIILAKLALSRGDLGMGLKEISEILEKQPGHFSARALLAQLRARQGRLDLAEEQMRILHEANPDSLPGLLPLAGVLVKQGKTSEARIYLNRLITHKPELTEARALLIESFLIEGQTDSVISILDAWASEPIAPVAMIASHKARLLFLTGQVKEAEAVLKPFLKLKEENLPALFELAKLKAKQQQYDSALAVYKSISNRIPKMVDRCRILSHFLHLRSGYNAQALTVLKMFKVFAEQVVYPRSQVACYLAMDLEHDADEFIKSQPDSLAGILRHFKSQIGSDKSIVGYWAMVNYYKLLEDKLWVLNSLDVMNKRWPSNRMVSDQFAQHLAAAGELKPAVITLERNPSNKLSQNLFQLSLYLKSGMKRKAFSKARSINMSHPGTRGVNGLMADYYFSRNDKTTAVLHWEKELAVAPGDIKSLNNLVWHYGIDKKDIGKAESYLEQLKKENPMDSRVLDTMGWVLAQWGRFDEAEPYLQLALNLLPDDPNLLYHYAWVQSKGANPQKAVKHLELALGSKRGFPDKLNAEKLLSSLKK